MPGTRRRRHNAREWSELVSAWKRSGESAAAFSRSQGISAKRLEWWTRRLGRENRADESAPRLVAVQVSNDDPGQRLAWELVAPSGHRVRVYEGAGDEILKTTVPWVRRNPATAWRH
jgi:hypothetical protein